MLESKKRSSRKKGLEVRVLKEMEINKEIMFNFAKQDNKIVQVIQEVTEKGFPFQANSYIKIRIYEICTNCIQTDPLMIVSFKLLSIRYWGGRYERMVRIFHEASAFLCLCLRFHEKILSAANCKNKSKTHTQ